MARASVLVPILDPDAHLGRLMDAYAEAVNYAIRAGIQHNATSLGTLTRLCYHQLRQRLTLKAMYVASAIKHAVGILRSWRRRKRRGLPVESTPVFKGRSMRLHKQVHRVDVERGVLRISTARGMRYYTIGVHKQVRRYVAEGWEMKESLVLRRDGRYYLVLCFEKAVDPIPVEDAVGVDVNENNVTACFGPLAVKFITHEREIRTAYWLKRRRIQSKIRAGKRRKQLLAKYGRREKERMKHIYHRVANAIVRLAAARRCAIVLEDLKNIKRRIDYTREMNGRLHRWGARLFQRILAEKAERAGVPVVFVNPARTSSLCPICGRGLKRSPKGQRVLVCPACGLEADRDVVAAANIRLRGLQKMGGRSSGPDSPPMNLEAGIVRTVVVVDAPHSAGVWGSTAVAVQDGQWHSAQAMLGAEQSGDQDSVRTSRGTLNPLPPARFENGIRTPSERAEANTKYGAPILAEVGIRTPSERAEAAFPHLSHPSPQKGSGLRQNEPRLERAEERAPRSERAGEEGLFT